MKKFKLAWTRACFIPLLFDRETLSERVYIYSGKPSKRFFETSFEGLSCTSIISGFQALSLHTRESRDQRDQRVYPPHISQLLGYFRKQVQELGNSGRVPRPNPRICISCCLLGAVEVTNTSTSYSSLEETTTFALRIVPCLLKR